LIVLSNLPLCSKYLEFDIRGRKKAKEVISKGKAVKGSSRLRLRRSSLIFFFPLPPKES